MGNHCDIQEMFDFLSQMIEINRNENGSAGDFGNLEEMTNRRLSDHSLMFYQRFPNLADDFKVQMKDTKCLSGCEAEIFLQILLYLLTQLNQTIESQMEEYRFNKPNQTSQSTYSDNSAPPPLSPDVLSIGQNDILSKVLQIIVTLGILPHLPVGVGLSINSRSQFADLISSLVHSNTESLCHNVLTILNIVKAAHIRSLFLDKHVSDLLAGLMVVAHYQQQSQSRASESINTASESQHKPDKHVNKASPGHNAMANEFIQAEMDNLIMKSYPPLIVREILMLQGGGRAKTPGYVRAMCGRYLTRILLSKGGVKAIVGGMITSESNDWKKFEMVGGVIATPPKGWTAEKYYKLISPQVLSLLKDNDDGSEEVNRQYYRVCAAILCSVQTKNTQLMYEHFWSQLIGDVSTEMSALTIKYLYKLICCGVEPQSNLIRYCTEVMTPIFTVYMRNIHTVIVTDTRLCCEELLSYCLQFSDDQLINSFLNHITFSDKQIRIQGDKAASIHSADDLSTEQLRTSAILFCLSKVTSQKLIQDYFMNLLQAVTGLLTVPVDPVYGRSLSELSLLALKFRVMSLLSSLCENHSSACLKQPIHIIMFVKSTLDRVLAGVEKTELGGDMTSNETLSLSLGLLTALLSGASDVKMSDSDMVCLRDLSDPLNKISLVEGLAQDTRELALNIRVAIATQGLVLLKSSTNDSVSAEGQKQTASKSDNASVQPSVTATQDEPPAMITLAEPLGTVEPHLNDTVLNDGSTNLNHVKSDQSATCSFPIGPPKKDTSLFLGDVTSRLNNAQPHDTRSSSKSEYEIAIDEISDSLIAVKGHALIQLAKLIKRRDKQTLDNSETLLALLIEHLPHSDTYIYLSAINAISALSDTKAVKVLDALCKNFNNQNIVTETRLKVGEVITKITRHLGDMAAAYSNIILPSILMGCKAEHDILRSSSLVNLGELCQLLKYSFGDNVNEISECLSGCLSDSCAASRRASAYSISLIISGLHMQCFQVFGSRNMTRLYKSLKSAVSRFDNDDVTSHHCALAIDAMDKMVKNSMYSKSKLEKRIYVLDAPPK